MSEILKNKIKHFSQLEKEWNYLQKKINLNNNITEKKNCPICGNKKKLKIIFKKKGLNFVKCNCNNSNHIFINPAIKSKILDNHFKKSQSWKTWAKKVLIKKIKDKSENQKFSDSIKKIKQFKKKKFVTYLISDVLLEIFSDTVKKILNGNFMELNHRMNLLKLPENIAIKI